MTLTLEPKTAIKPIAIYERVSSQDQRERATILTQRQELGRKVNADQNVRVYERYSDDGESGTKPLAERPGGIRLIRDAQLGCFDEIWVYKVDRLARDEEEAFHIRRLFRELGIKLVSVCENIESDFVYGIHALMAGEERRVFLARSAAGMNRAASEGRYTGGIVPMGFKVVGLKQHAHFEPCDDIMWAKLTEADVVRKIYNHLTVDGWSCVKIAREFNTLGIPTDYVHDNREIKVKGQRKTHTQGIWRAGHIRNLVVNPVYKGLLQYGRRSKKPGGREIIPASVPALVSVEIWQAAQEALARNRIIAKNTPRNYLLTGLVKCGECGKTYCAAHGRGEVHWWRCNGRMTSRYDDRCKGKGIKSTEIEGQVWQDIERWARNPGDLIKELEAEKEQGKVAAAKQDEISNLESQLIELEKRKKNYHRQAAQGLLSDELLKEFLDELTKSKEAIENRLKELTPSQEVEQEQLSPDLLQEIRNRLGAGLSEEQRQEIARLLVKRITIRTKTEGDTKQCVAEVEYRFPLGAVSTCTGTGSSLPPAGNWPDMLPSPGHG